MAKVTVGCKLPSGLQLRIDDTLVVLNGSNSSLVIGGYGLTENVDKEFFDKWMGVNKDAACVLNGFVFAQERTANAKAEAADNAANINGFEGLNPAAPAPGITQADGK